MSLHLEVLQISIGIFGYRIGNGIDRLIPIFGCHMNGPMSFGCLTKEHDLRSVGGFITNLRIRTACR